MSSVVSPPSGKVAAPPVPPVDRDGPPLPRSGGRAERAARTLGVALMFATFGVGALLLAGIVIPMARWTRGTRKSRDLVAQRWIQRSFALFLWMGERLRLFEVHRSHTERLRNCNGIVVANHPTLLDVVFLISCMPQADCVVKREAWRNPFLRWIVSSAGYIRNEGGSKLVDACVERVSIGRAIILFPEGTRSPAGGLGPFKRGAARVALNSGCEITPVLISSTPPVLMKGIPWYAIPSRKMVFSLDVGPGIVVDRERGPEEPTAVAARRLTEKLQTHFEARLADVRT